MSVKKIISNMLPKGSVKVARYKYRKLRQRLYKPMSEAYFIDILTSTLNIKEGDTLFIHSSMDFINVKFSPFRLLQMLIDITGKEGTLIFPGWHFNYRAEDYLTNENSIFDIQIGRAHV